MKYIYSAEGCSKCKVLKDKYNVAGIVFEERSADRIKSPVDEIDREALIQASIQNMALPVEVEM